MTDTLAALRVLLRKLTGCSDGDKRDLVCTPCGGNYGCVESWVVAVNGSPARGTFFIGQNHYSYADDVFFICQDKSRRLGAEQARIVRAFEAEYLGPQHMRITEAKVKTIRPREYDNPRAKAICEATLPGGGVSDRADEPAPNGAGDRSVPGLGEAVVGPELTSSMEVLGMGHV